MSHSGVSVHDVMEVKMEDPKRLDTTCTRTIRVKTSDNSVMEIVLFSSDTENLKLKP